VVADSLGIRVLKTTKLDAAALEIVRESGARLGVVVAFGAILRTDALDALDLGWFNLHYSLLPSWRGAAPVQHALLNSEKITGVTLFRIDEGLDTGDIVNQVAVPIEVTDNSASLLTRLTGIGTSLLLQEIPKLLAGMAKFQPQSVSGVCLAPKPTRIDARLGATEPASLLLAKVRAFNPEPGAWLLWQGQPFKVLEAATAPESIVPIFRVQALGEAILVGTQKGALRLIEVQPAGKSAMPASDWFRGTTDNTRIFE
jgi:methionyl-tRNA formyltransferase